MHSRNNNQKHIWMLCGTGDGPPLARALIKHGWSVSVSVVTAQAALAYEEVPLEALWIGPIDGLAGIQKVLMRSQAEHSGFNWVIDATHPFAVVISSELVKGCREFGQSLIRFERSLDVLDTAHLIETTKDLPKGIVNGRNVLLAIGARFLPEAVAAANKGGATVYARILPSLESLQIALSAQLKDGHLAVLRPLKGEIIGEYELALCRRWSIDCVVCRQSGGLTQQIWQEICKDNNLDLLLISRPEPGHGVEVVRTLEMLLNRLAMP